ncbi:MAG: hypothetical protein OEU54_11890 [Gemmatimonadota bacterium]|nr:hypothetical protein [Gemmatimonadota bacterium]
MFKFLGPSAALILVCSGLLGGPSAAHAQDVEVIFPGHPALESSRIQPFEAEYEQMGFAFLTRLVRTNQARPVLSFQMIMEGPDGVGIDHVGHRADDLAFAYRRFGFRAFRPEYIDARVEGDSLRLRRLSLAEGSDSNDLPVVQRLERPIVDGTFAYWLAAALPLREGYRWRWHTWQPTATGLEIRDTPVFEVTGREEITLEDGARLDAWVVAVEGASGTTRMWVSESPPYLVRQDVVPPGGEPQTVIELKRVRP